MTIAEYVACFQTLSKYLAAIISTNFERLPKFVKGLDGTYQLDITQMVVFGDYFQSIIEHA